MTRRRGPNEFAMVWLLALGIPLVLLWFQLDRDPTTQAASNSARDTS